VLVTALLPTPHPHAPVTFDLEPTHRRPTVLLLLKLAFEFGLFLCVIIYLICCCHLATFFGPCRFGFDFLPLGFRSLGARPCHPSWVPPFYSTPLCKSPISPPPTAIVIDALLLFLYWCCFRLNKFFYFFFGFFCFSILAALGYVCCSALCFGIFAIISRTKCGFSSLIAFGPSMCRFACVYMSVVILANFHSINISIDLYAEHKRRSLIRVLSPSATLTAKQQLAILLLLLVSDAVAVGSEVIWHWRFYMPTL